MEKPHNKIDVLNKKDSSRLTLYGSRGFTLLEVVMVIILMGIIGSTAAMIIFQGARSYGEEEVRKDLTTQGRLAIERMAREIRLVNCRCATPANTCTPSGASCTPPALEDITSWTAAEFRFNNINYDDKGFRASGVNLLMRSAGTEDTLASNITSLSFSYFKKDGTAAAAVGDIWTIVANLTLTRDNQSVNFKIQAHPRRFE